MIALTLPDQRIYTVKEVAVYLRVSAKTVRKMIAQGRLDAFLVGDEYRISQGALDRLEESRKKEDQGE